MSGLTRFLNHTVAAFAVTYTFSLPAPAAESGRLDDLFAQLAQDGLANWRVVEQEIWMEWSKSGSSAMDLLLQRGREAMEADDLDAAVEHLTALTDHAPDFAEGFNARATAYYRQGLFGPAMQDIARALTLNPRHFGALIGLGTIFEEMGQPGRALEAYRAARAIHPNEPDLKGAIERLEKELSGTTL
ncbi:tetratricopeptide repeat protein [Actibacterium sp. MT2.3-13A]|uniref:tetratricopeptide repeat protein n=1 Tax=Actibacterium sp. MT2.3-13A TaxID=2828332 RepID=UPI001BA5F78A|nr:tetratricopeptide repeat protein [Actibacterium sp. MT2.3-13A]